jgi:hypothetical protein
MMLSRATKGESLLHERKRWYDRLKAEGRLDEYRVRDEWLRWKSIARILLLLLILYAMGTRLLH